VTLALLDGRTRRVRKGIVETARELRVAPISLSLYVWIFWPVALYRRIKHNLVKSKNEEVG
jgi:hypothetical protein